MTLKMGDFVVLYIKLNIPDIRKYWGEILQLHTSSNPLFYLFDKQQLILTLMLFFIISMLSSKMLLLI